MTENKRFWILNALTEYSGIKDKDKLLTFDEVVDLLNEQHEQIERLKGNFRALDEVKCELTDENEKLEKENKELQYKLRNCEDARASYKQDFMKLIARKLNV